MPRAFILQANRLFSGAVHGYMGALLRVLGMTQCPAQVTEEVCLVFMAVSVWVRARQRERCSVYIRSLGFSPWALARERDEIYGGVLDRQHVSLCASPLVDAGHRYRHSES